jgi:signal transduction histidine kinase
MAIKVVVGGSLEDHALVRYALSAGMLQTAVDAGTDGFRTLELTGRVRPDVVLVDPSIPSLSGPQLVARLRRESPASPVVCWTARPDLEEAVELLLAGAAGYLLKEDGPSDLADRITAVLDGGLVIAPKIAAQLMPRFAHAIQRESDLTRTLGETTMRLQEVVGTKDQFIANVNHELRTPVTIVKGIAHLLKSGRLTENDQEQFLNRMDAALEKLTVTVEEIVSVADLGQGRLTLDPRRVEMSVLAHEVCDGVAEAYPDSVIERSIKPSLGVLADRARIAQAMKQLVENACRFSPPGGRIEVSLRRLSEGVQFSVTDSGIGVPRHIVTKAFQEPFVTAENVLRKERAGLGIGLHLARQLVVMHGGVMSADPLPAGGSRVRFCIPEHSPLLQISSDDVPATPSRPERAPVRREVEAMVPPRYTE